MKRLGFVTAFGLTALLASGCKGLTSSLLPEQVPPKPSTFWESEPTQILDIRGPATGIQNQEVEVTITAVIGSSSCNRFGEASLVVDDASQAVTVRATRLTKRASEPLPCTEDFGWTTAKVSFIPTATGTYRISADPFMSGHSDPGQATPQATFDIVVSAP